MVMTVNAKDLDSADHGMQLEAPPDACPICHRSVHPTYLMSALLRERGGRAISVFRCTHRACQELFLAYYEPEPHGTMRNPRPLQKLKVTKPFAAQVPAVPEAVANLSASFVEIYSQALASEAHGLDQLVGIGLRKALEFLVKDYVISLHPQSADAIRTTLLGPCIEQYVSDPNVKQCAKRAAWLGNDETHYTRKWETRDIDDLKRLVRLTINWIDSDLLTKQYLADMQPTKA